MNECIVTNMQIEPGQRILVGDNQYAYGPQGCTATIRFIGEPPLDAFNGGIEKFCLVPSPSPPPPNETICKGKRPTLIEPSDKYSEGGLGEVPAWAWKLLGVIAWASFWWVAARAM